MNKCSKCGTEFEGKFCPECGTKADDKICPECGAHVASAAKFCPECGHALDGNAAKNAAPATQTRPAAPTSRPTAPARPATPAAKPARHVPWFMWRLVKALDIAAVVMLPLFSVLVLFFLMGSAISSPLPEANISAYATMRAGGKEGGMMVALLVFAIIGLILGAVAVFMLVRRFYGFAAMIATLAINFVICLVDIIVCARFGKLVDEMSAEMFVMYFVTAETGAAIRLTLGFGITFMILSLLVLAGRIAIAVLFPSVKEETVARPRRERQSISRVEIMEKFIAVVEWIMALAPLVFAVLTLILAAFPAVSLDEEVYGASSAGNLYSGKVGRAIDSAGIFAPAIGLLVAGIVFWLMKGIGHKTTLGFALILLCIPTLSYIFLAIAAFATSGMLGDVFVLEGLAHVGAGITLLKVLSIILAIITPILFAVWLVTKRKFPSGVVEFVGDLGAHKVLAVFVALIITAATGVVGAGGIVSVVERKESAKRWDAFSACNINDKYKEYTSDNSSYYSFEVVFTGTEYYSYKDIWGNYGRDPEPIILSDNVRVFVTDGPKMIYDNLNALAEQQAAALAELDMDEYQYLTNKIERVKEKLSSAPFAAVALQTGEGYITEIEYNPNYKFVYKLGEVVTKTVSAARATACDRVYCTDTRTATKTETPLSAPYGTYRLDFTDGGYRMGRLTVFDVALYGNRNAVTWTDEYGSHTAPVGDTGVELFTIDSEGTLKRTTQSSEAQFVWDNIPSPITSFVVPDGVTSIASDTFKDCVTLTSIDIPDSVTSIGSGAFSGCTNLQASTTDGNAKYLGNSENPYLYLWEVTNKSITNFTVNEKTKIIQSGAFEGCNSLEKIDVALGNTAYVSQDGILYNYDKTRFVHIPAEIKGAITIPDGITSIGDRAFYNRSNLTEITIPASIISIGKNAFSGCSSLNKVNITDLAAWCNIDFDGSSANPLYYARNLYTNGDLQQEITIPQEITEIKDYTFYNCKSITSVTIHEGVTAIGNYAFSGCGFTEITIPASVTSIGDRAFYNCSNLASITIPANVTHIGDEAFAGCSKLTSITLPESLTSIGGSAFSGCSKLTEITIPASVTSIGGRAFEYCYDLQTVTFDGESKLESIGYEAFNCCRKLTEITIPASVTSIGYSAFSGCTNLQPSTTDGNAKYLGNSENPYLYLWEVADKSITNFTVNEKTKIIQSEAFSGCDDLQTVNWNATNCTRGGFSACPSLTTVNIGANVQTIPDYAFSDCSNLTSITIPESVTHIGDGAFAGCSNLTSITIPGSVTYIGDEAFRDTDLQTATFENPNGWKRSSDGFGRSNGHKNLNLRIKAA